MEMGFIFCGQHPLLVTRSQMSDPGPMGPLVSFAPTCLINSIIHEHSCKILYLLYHTRYKKEIYIKTDVFHL